MLRKIVSCFVLVVLLVMIPGGCSPGFLSDLYPVKDTIELDGEGNSRHADSEESSESPVDSQAGAEQTDHWVYVHVCGCVKNPGMYRLQEGDRVDAAIKSAGGFTGDADEKSVNLARLLEDGTQIEVLSRSVTKEKNTSGDKRIDLNLAGIEDLMTLSGIGESRALAIIAYREEHGGFRSVEELKEVEGIGEGIYRKIKNAIKI